MKITPLFLGSVLIASGGRFATASEPREVTVAWATNTFCSVNLGAGLEGIAPSRSNSVYVAGGFGGTLTFGNFSVTSSGDYDVWIAKLNDRGQPLWLKSMGSAKRDSFGAMAADALGNVFVTFGTYLGIPPAYPSEGFLVKCDPQGSELWRRSLGNTQIRPRALAIGPDGSIYLADRDNLAKVFFLRKYDPNGLLVWSRETLYTGSLGAERMGIDAENRLYVSIGLSTGSSIQFGSPVFVSSNGLVLVQFDKDGEFLSSQQNPEHALVFGSEDEPLWIRPVWGSSVVGFSRWARHQGLIYATGDFRQNVNFGGVDLQHTGEADTFLMQVNESGGVKWATRFGGPNYEGARALAVGQDGAVYIGGEIGREGGSFNQFHLQGQSIGEGFIIKVMVEPKLRFARSENTLVLSWQLSAADYIVEQAGSLQPGTVWMEVPTPPVAVGDDYVVTVDIGPGSQLFRLRKQ